MVSSANSQQQMQAANMQTIQSANTLASPRTFLSLPRELRDVIYIMYFSQVTFWRHDRWHRGPPKALSDHLALLRTCRKIKLETKDLWIGLVDFKYKNVKVMMDQLGALKPDVLSKVRRVQVKLRDLSLDDKTPDIRHGLGVPGVLGEPRPSQLAFRWLHGLCLDSLVLFTKPVKDPCGWNEIQAAGNMTSLTIVDIYASIFGLIHHDNGWRVLHVVGDPAILAFPLFVTPFTSRVRFEPHNWSRVLAERDGAESEASVVIYISTQHNSSNTSILDPQNRKVFKMCQWRIKPNESELKFRARVYNKLIAATKAKKILVAIRRGAGAKVENDVDPKDPYYEGDWTARCEGATHWSDIAGVYQPWRWNGGPRKKENEHEGCPDTRPFFSDFFGGPRPYDSNFTSENQRENGDAMLACAERKVEEGLKEEPEEIPDDDFDDAGFDSEG